MKKKQQNIPQHIAFIMDGNRRWAQRRGLSKMIGHKFGAETLKKIIIALTKIEGIKFASFFGFSTENWNRSQKEIDYIFNVAYDFVEKYENDFKNCNVKFVHMGDISKFPEKLRGIILKLTKETENNDGLVVNLAVNYGGRADIVHAANRLLEEGVKEFTEENIASKLYSAPAPDVDLVVRTSGEKRISNFMLYQMAYSELYFTKKFWPDFNEKQLDKAIGAFSKRNRRFGGK